MLLKNLDKNSHKKVLKIIFIKNFWGAQFCTFLDDFSSIFHLFRFAINKERTNNLFQIVFFDVYPAGSSKLCDFFRRFTNRQDEAKYIWINLLSNHFLLLTVGWEDVFKLCEGLVPRLRQKAKGKSCPKEGSQRLEQNAE